MEIVNILTAITQAPIDLDINLNFIGKFIEWLINITNVGVGIILFTLVLKLIVMPFDVYSKIKMKQNSVKMEAMREDLEKLQKQYAHDKNLYNQKMMALQKKNGYSPLSGCLPLVLSLVIFIVAINAFRSYSAFAMKNEYNEIVDYYNKTVVELTVEGENPDLFSKDENGKVYFNNANFLNHVSVNESKYAGINSVLKVDSSTGNVTLNVDRENGNVFSTEAENAIKSLLENEIISDYTDNFKLIDGVYRFETNKEETFVACAKEIINNIELEYFNSNYKSAVDAAVKEAYEGGKIKVSSFLWVKNVWLPDVSYEHPINPDVEKFKTSISSAATQSCTCNNAIEVVIENYDIVTAGLSDQKKSANGYFIMVVLSILTMLLSQFISQKMQKSQLELQTVDGQAAMTQKMMLWMMPIMFGMFAFSYSTAFSIYMTVSSIVSTASSALINLYVEKKYNKPVELNEGRSKKNIKKIEKAKAEAEEKERQKKEEKLQKKNKSKNNDSSAEKKDFLNKK